MTTTKAEYRLFLIDVNYGSGGNFEVFHRGWYASVTTRRRVTFSASFLGDYFGSSESSGEDYKEPQAGIDYPSCAVMQHWKALDPPDTFWIAKPKCKRPWYKRRRCCPSFYPDVRSTMSAIRSLINEAYSRAESQDNYAFQAKAIMDAEDLLRQ